MDKCFLSFGPNCLAADILRQSGLREMTYGFDWFRSGSWHHREFLLNPLSDFLSTYVYKPSVPLYQPRDPASTQEKTVELSPRSFIYGYHTLYNPHRSLYNEENRRYFKRCFERLNNALDKSSLEKNIILADYSNKPGNSMITCHTKALSYLSSLLLLRSIEHKLIFCKLVLSTKNHGIIREQSLLPSGKLATILTLFIDPTVDNNPTTRRERLSMFAKDLTS